MSDTNTWIHAIKFLSYRGGPELGDAEIIKISNEWDSFQDWHNCHKLNLDLEASAKQIELYKSKGIKITNIFDSDYPRILKKLNSPPSILYYYGDLNSIDHQHNISIVGTRNASLYSKHCTRAMVQACKNYDTCIVSGLARGIDSEAHGTALANHLPTIAILGSGLLKYGYSGTQRKLFNDIKACPQNLIISEFEPHEEAKSWTFASRNRIIAALSFATIVVEAPRKSGALITADYALELERELYTIPGELGKDNFQGSNQLLVEDKAKPIFSIKQVPELLGLDYQEPTLSPENPELLDFNTQSSYIGQKILDSIDIEPVSLDYLVKKLEYSYATLLSNLSLLEIQGLVTKESGAKYAKARF